MEIRVVANAESPDTDTVQTAKGPETIYVSKEVILDWGSFRNAGTATMILPSGSSPLNS
jgi:hypothetical protein